MEVLNGEQLIQTVVTLTELPEPLVHREMNEVLLRAGHESENLTLEQLRLAMLGYLEAIHQEMVGVGEAPVSASISSDDAASDKPLVIVE